MWVVDNPTEETIPYEPRGADEVPISLFPLPSVREGCIVDGWIVRCWFRRDWVIVNASEVIVLVDAKDVAE